MSTPLVFDFSEIARNMRADSIDEDNIKKLKECYSACQCRTPADCPFTRCIGCNMRLKPKSGKPFTIEEYRAALGDVSLNPNNQCSVCGGPC